MPELLELREDMMLAISPLPVGYRNIALPLSFTSLENIYVHISCCFCSFSYIRKVFKSVSVQLAHWKVQFLEK